MPLDADVTVVVPAKDAMSNKSPFKV